MANGKISRFIIRYTPSCIERFRASRRRHRIAEIETVVQSMVGSTETLTVAHTTAGPMPLRSILKNKSIPDLRVPPVPQRNLRRYASQPEIAPVQHPYNPWAYRPPSVVPPALPPMRPYSAAPASPRVPNKRAWLTYGHEAEHMIDDMMRWLDDMTMPEHPAYRAKP